jgi:hypothetical protein
MKSEPEEIRFGIIAVKKGFSTPEQIVKAFEFQLSEDLAGGEHSRIGKILLDQGVITPPQLNEILQDLKKPDQI